VSPLPCILELRLPSMRARRSSSDAERHVSLRCLIVDDSEQFLRAASSSLGRDGIEVVGTAGSSSAAFDQVETLRPDVVLVDVALGEESGFDLTSRLVDAFPYLESRIVLISTRAEDEYGDLVEACRAVGFIPKSELSLGAVRELVPANDS
jgi:DNA-binding NarL/FixJ family response regulator